MRRLVLAAALIMAAATVQAQADPQGAPYRYRAAIVSLMQLKAGMTAAEVNPTPGVVAPELLKVVTTSGRAITAALNVKTGATSLEPGSADAVALVSALTMTDQYKPLFDGLAGAVKPGGVLLVVDVPQENDGKKVVGLEADDVVKLATAAGFKREVESGIVPGHYAIRFRKQ
jgi:predicted methyltransferase